MIQYGNCSNHAMITHTSNSHVKLQVLASAFIANWYVILLALLIWIFNTLQNIYLTHYKITAFYLSVASSTLHQALFEAMKDMSTGNTQLEILCTGHGAIMLPQSSCNSDSNLAFPWPLNFRRLDSVSIHELVKLR